MSATSVHAAQRRLAALRRDQLPDLTPAERELALLLSRSIFREARRHQLGLRPAEAAAQSRAKREARFVDAVYSASLAAAAATTAVSLERADPAAFEVWRSETAAFLAATAAHVRGYVHASLKVAAHAADRLDVVAAEVARRTFEALCRPESAGEILAA